MLLKGEWPTTSNLARTFQHHRSICGRVTDDSISYHGAVWKGGISLYCFFLRVEGVDVYQILACYRFQGRPSPNSHDATLPLPFPFSPSSFLHSPFPSLPSPTLPSPLPSLAPPSHPSFP